MPLRTVYFDIQLLGYSTISHLPQKSSIPFEFRKNHCKRGAAPVSMQRVTIGDGI